MAAQVGLYCTFLCHVLLAHCKVSAHDLLLCDHGFEYSAVIKTVTQVSLHFQSQLKRARFRRITTNLVAMAQQRSWKVAAVSLHNLHLS